MPLNYQTKLAFVESDPEYLSWVFGTSGGVTPEDSYLHQKLGGDFGKYEEMLIDPQVRGKVNERVGALLGRSVLVDPITESKSDKAAADVAKRIIDGNLVPYEQICGTFLFSGLIMGFSVQAVAGAEEKTYFYPINNEEGEYQSTGKMTVLVPRLEFVPQRRFVFRYHEPDRKDIRTVNDEDSDPETEIALVHGYELRLLTKRSPLEGERCPKDKFFVYTFGSLKGLPYGYGLGAMIRKFYEIRSECLKSGVLSGDRLGSPPTHGTYPNDIDESDPEQAAVIAAFTRLVRAISPNAYAVTTDGFKINFPESKTPGHQLLKWLYDTAGLEITRAIWGEGSYSEKETGSFAADQQQAENRNENTVDADCNSLDEQLAGHFWKWIGDNNYPKANYPKIRRDTYAERVKAEQEKVKAKEEREEEDAKEQRRQARSQVDRTLLIDLGLNVTNEYIQETYGEAFSLPDQAPPPEPAEEEIVDPELSEANFAANVDRYLDWQNLRIGVRWLPGQTRFPQHRTSKKLQNAYGFVQGTRQGGKALRCYLHPGLLEGESGGESFLVTQLSPRTSEVDEYKLMLGYPSIEAAELAYRREMPEAYFGGIEAIAPDELEELDFAESEYRLFFFENRRTGIVARNVEEARSKMKRGGSKLVKVRSLTESELKQAKKGIWIRTGPNGEKPGYPGKRGMGPPVGGYSEEPTEEGLIEFAESKSKFADESLHQRAIAEAKRRFKVYPSAYASSFVVKRYKELYKEKHGNTSGAFSGSKDEGLSKWYKEDWVRIGADGEILGVCGDRTDKEGKPKCLPRAKAESMSKEERSAAVRRKRRNDPDPDRRGAPKNVSTFADIPDDDPIDVYEERLVTQLSEAYDQALDPIAQFIESISNSAGTDAEKYRRFVDGLAGLYGQMDTGAIASVLGDGLTAGYYAGLYSERLDRDE